ncbi:Ig-like domain-containing protein [Hymenobacter nivis]|uniref:Fibronectin type-III domain-containing protein n=1 Tax=Hymenobacter nivis TaxID=1850093 RepID=A0A502GV05_9BACT|nr:Ig-like domain-containing protein [Hymenobacter nivis]TPG66059.1 hypothetical protein EAH73_11865 [Hymenobacter nivis]
MAYTDSLPFWPVNQALPLDGGFFFYDPNSGLEYRVAPEMLAGSAATQGVAELKLPQPVVLDALYLTPTGVWAPRRSFNAAAPPVAGANWRLVLAAGNNAPAGLLDDRYTATVSGAQPVISVTGALKFFNVVVFDPAQPEAGGIELYRGLHYTDDGAGNLTLLAAAGIQAGEMVQYCWVTGALAAGSPQFSPIAANRYGRHPAFQGQYGDQGVNAFLLAQVVQLQQATVGQQPDAPTAGQVDDTGDTFSFLANPAFPSPGQYQVAGLPGATGPVYLDGTNSYVTGGRTYVKVAGPVGAGGLAVYVAGATTRPDGLPLTNKEPFTGSTVVVPPTDTTAPNVAITVPAAGAVLTPGTQITLTATATDNVGVQVLVFTNGATGAFLGNGAKNGNTYTCGYTVPSTAGALTLTATATDAAANSQQATVNVTVQAAGATQLAAPTGLAATPTSATTIGISWNPVTNATGYRLRRKTDGATVYASTGTSYVDTGRTASTTYSYDVLAEGSGAYSNSDYSGAASATTPAGGSGPTVLSPAEANWFYSQGTYRTYNGVNYPAGLAVLKVLTNAAQLVLRAASNYPDNNGSISVRQGATLIGTYPITAQAGQDFTVAVPNPGSGTAVEIAVNNSQRGNEAGDVYSATVLSVTVPAGATGSLLARTQAGVVVFDDADSLGVGYGASAPAFTSTAGLLRSAGQDINEANYGSARGAVQYSLGNWNAKKAQLHAALDGASTPKYLMRLMVNDYLSNTLNPTDFKALLLAHMGRVHAEFPTLRMGLETATAIQNEAANALGFTLPQYRQAAIDACTTFGMAYKDGLAYGGYDSGFYFDTVHLNDAGYARTVSGRQTFINNLTVPTGTTALPDGGTYSARTSADNKYIEMANSVGLVSSAFFMSGVFTISSYTQLSMVLAGILRVQNGDDSTAGFFIYEPVSGSAERVLRASYRTNQGQRFDDSLGVTLALNKPYWLAIKAVIGQPIKAWIGDVNAGTITAYTPNGTVLAGALQASSVPLMIGAAYFQDGTTRIGFVDQAVQDFALSGNVDVTDEQVAYAFSTTGGKRRGQIKADGGAFNLSTPGLIAVSSLLSTSPNATSWGNLVDSTRNFVLKTG